MDNLKIVLKIYIKISLRSRIIYLAEVLPKLQVKNYFLVFQENSRNQYFTNLYFLFQLE